MTVLLERPWDRVKTPTAIPASLTAETLEGLPAEEFARLLRDHLVPREATGPGRQRWQEMWNLLSRDDDLAERAFDVLEEFLDQVEEALEDKSLDEHQRKRAQKFARFCDDAWKRLQIDDDKPLAWAGRAAAGFNPPGRKVIDQLVTAIAAHRREVQASRAGRPEDERLWRSLRAVGLDPDQKRRRR
jgi:hypothetical protein